MRWLVVGEVVCLMGIGTANAQPPPPDYAPIPPPRAEMVPPPPGGPVIWQPGHWHWDGYRYVWRPGQYVQRRPDYGHYAEGRWMGAARGAVDLAPSALGVAVILAA